MQITCKKWNGGESGGKDVWVGDGAAVDGWAEKFDGLVGCYAEWLVGWVGRRVQMVGVWGKVRRMGRQLCGIHQERIPGSSSVALSPALSSASVLPKQASPSPALPRIKIAVLAQKHSRFYTQFSLPLMVPPGMANDFSAQEYKGCLPSPAS